MVSKTPAILLNLKVLYNFTPLSMKKGKQIVNARAMTVDSIRFRSRLEAYTYQALKKMSVPSEYEKRNFTLVEGFRPTVECWEHRYGTFRQRTSKCLPITYTPDFTCPDMTWVIEVKGRANESFPLRWKMFRKMMEGKSVRLFLCESRSDVDQAVKMIRDYAERTS